MKLLEYQTKKEKNRRRKKKIPINITVQNNENASHLQTSQKHFHRAPASNLASICSGRELKFIERR